MGVVFLIFFIILLVCKCMLLKFDGCKFVFILLFGIFLFRILEFLLIIFLIWLFCGCGIWVGCDGVIKEFLLLVVFCCLYLVLMNLVVFINFRVLWLFVYKNLWYFNIFFFFCFVSNCGENGRIFGICIICLLWC